ncbi:hypothetical protein ACJX0J_038266, partial [Zea mays]
AECALHVMFMGFQRLNPSIILEFSIFLCTFFGLTYEVYNFLSNVNFNFISKVNSLYLLI